MRVRYPVLPLALLQYFSKKYFHGLVKRRIMKDQSAAIDISQFSI